MCTSLAGVASSERRDRGIPVWHYVAAAGTMHAAAALLGSKILRQAADAYDRTASELGADMVKVNFP
jgi:DhnA family fructose-bisphosphate aldolase class Ia